MREKIISGEFSPLSSHDVFFYADCFCWLRDQADQQDFPVEIINFLSEFSSVFLAEKARLMRLLQ